MKKMKDKNGVEWFVDEENVILKGKAKDIKKTTSEVIRNAKKQ